MSSDTPFSVYGDVPEVQGISSCSLKARYAEEHGVYPNEQQLAALTAKWHEENPHPLSAAAHRSAKRARVGEIKQGGAKKSSKHDETSVGVEDDDEEEMAVAGSQPNAHPYDQLEGNEERLALRRLELTPFVGASPAEIHGGPLGNGSPIPFPGFASRPSPGGAYISPAAAGSHAQDASFSHQPSHDVFGSSSPAAGPSAMLADPFASPSPSRAAANNQGTTGAVGPSFAAGLHAPWAPFGAYHNDPLADLSLADRTAPPDPNGLHYHLFAPSPAAAAAAAAAAPPGPADASIVVNVQPAAQKKGENAPWSEAETATLKRLAAEGVGYTGIHKREFSETRTLKAVQMKYYQLISADERRSSKTKAKANKPKDE